MTNNEAFDAKLNQLLVDFDTHDAKNKSALNQRLATNRANFIEVNGLFNGIKTEIDKHERSCTIEATLDSIRLTISKDGSSEFFYLITVENFQDNSIYFVVTPLHEKSEISREDPVGVFRFYPEDVLRDFYMRYKDFLRNQHERFWEFNK